MKWQNIDLARYSNANCDGVFDFPKIKPVYELPKFDTTIAYEYCKRCQTTRVDRKTIGVHFFEDDYQFERCWTRPDQNGKMLSSFAFTLSPDFSVFTEFPLALQVFNHYRNNWLARYWQDKYDVTVIPTILWGDEFSYSWCFDGYPTNSIVAVSVVGNMKNSFDKEFFMRGYNEMLERLEPSQILVHSKDKQDLPGNTIHLPWQHYKGEMLYGNGPQDSVT